MLYLIGLFGLSSVILFLLYRYRGKAIDDLKKKVGLVEVDRDGWRQTYIWSEQLKDEVRKDVAEKIRQRISGKLKQLEQAKSVDIITDATGLGGAE